MDNTSIAQNDGGFNLELARQLWNSGEQFPVDFNQAWRWLGYSTKQKGFLKLTKNFDEGLDFLTKRLKTSTGGRPSQSIRLTVDCFKSLGMMAGTEQGREIRKYFLECERIAKSITPSLEDAIALPQTYIEALEALLESEKEKERLRLEAESLAQENGELMEEVEQLTEVVDELFDYSSIIRIAKFNNVSETRFNWRTLKRAATRLKLEIKKAPCPRYQTKNLYPHAAWMLAYPWVKLPECTSIVVASN